VADFHDVDFRVLSFPVPLHVAVPIEGELQVDDVHGLLVAFDELT
jgi:hypothetical protein